MITDNVLRHIALQITVCQSNIKTHQAHGEPYEGFLEEAKAHLADLRQANNALHALVGGTDQKGE